MGEAWCICCKATVSIRHAIRELPCPSCSGSSYMIAGCGSSFAIEVCDAKADVFMENGRWDEAAAEYLRCNELESSERTLRTATLEWRRDCANYIDKLLSKNAAGLSLGEFRQNLLDHYDEFVTSWVLQGYRGIKCIPNGSTYNIVRRIG